MGLVGGPLFCLPQRFNKYCTSMEDNLLKTFLSYSYNFSWIFLYAVDVENQSGTSSFLNLFSVGNHNLPQEELWHYYLALQYFFLSYFLPKTVGKKKDPQFYCSKNHVNYLLRKFSSCHHQLQTTVTL